MKIVDFCAGIGGFRFGLEKLGFETVYSCEINDYCEDTYRANFGVEFDAKDIAAIKTSDLPPYDVFCAGFPCQPFSIAGKREGFLDERSSVFEHIIRLVKATKPEVVLLENVKHLKHHDKGRTFKIIIKMLSEQGYYVRHQILNSKFYGVPQSRERIFIVGFRSPHAAQAFNFPVSSTVQQVMKDILIDGDMEHPLSNRWLEYIELYSGRKALNEMSFRVPKTRLSLEKAPVSHLDNYVLQMRSSGIRAIPISQPFPTFAVSVSGGGAMIPIYVKERRHLSLIEMKRLMGFHDSLIFNVARTHAIKQLANAVCPPVVNSLGKQILAAVDNNSQSFIFANPYSLSPYEQLRLI